jgi:hypothetical protein
MRMDDAKRAWDEVGDSFSKLGRKISEGYRQLDERVAPDPNPRTTEGQKEGVVPDAIRRATDELDRAFTSLGNTLRDSETQAHLLETGRKLGDALEITFTSISDQIRRAGRDRRPPDTGQGPPTSSPS